MYEGEYSGRMQPWRHYVPLKKDHSNHAEVVAVLKDPMRASEMVETAYREVACNQRNTFRAFVFQFDEVIAKAFRSDQKAFLSHLDDWEFDELSAPGWGLRGRWAVRSLVEASYRFLFSTLLGRTKPETRETVHAWLKVLLHPLRVVWGQLRS
jgi:hypothetical protein